jgi:hypothetical protein
MGLSSLLTILLEIFVVLLYFISVPLFAVSWFLLIIYLFLLSGQMYPARSTEGAKRRWNPVIGIIQPNLLTTTGLKSRKGLFYTVTGLVISVFSGLIFDFVWQTEEFHWWLFNLTIWLSTLTFSIIPLWVYLREFSMTSNRILKAFIGTFTLWLSSCILLTFVGTQFGIQGEAQMIFAFFSLINGVLFFISGLVFSVVYSKR